jgi:hypothetical protein
MKRFLTAALLVILVTASISFASVCGTVDVSILENIRLIQMDGTVNVTANDDLRQQLVAKKGMKVCLDGGLTALKADSMISCDPKAKLDMQPLVCYFDHYSKSIKANEIG